MPRWLRSIVHRWLGRVADDAESDPRPRPGVVRERPIPLDPQRDGDPPDPDPPAGE